MNMWIIWFIVLLVLAALFRWLWSIADKLDRKEAEERAWETYLQELWKLDPEKAAYWEWLRNQ